MFLIETHTYFISICFQGRETVLLLFLLVKSAYFISDYHFMYMPIMYLEYTTYHIHGIMPDLLVIISHVESIVLVNCKASCFYFSKGQQVLLITCPKHCS